MKQFILILFLGITIFPSLQAQQTVGLFVNDSLSQNGYTLWTTRGASWLIDNCGHLINKWDHDVRPGLSVYLLENGNLMRTGFVNGDFFAPGGGGLIQEYDWYGNLQWSYRVADSNKHQHHDIEPMPNGNVLVIAWELKTLEEVKNAGGQKNTVYWSEMILELEKVGTHEANVVWEWHLWDHLIQDFDADKENYGIVSDHPELMDVNYNPPIGSGISGGDWMHFNGIDYDPVRDEIILSCRSMNEVYIIDHSTTTLEAAGHTGGNRGKGGDFLYRWGNPEAYGRGNSEDRKFYGQHNAEIIQEGYPGAGSISVFNNGSQRPEGRFSTVEVFSPPRDADGNYILSDEQVYGPRELDWIYTDPDPESFFSNNISGAQRLANGNTFICEGASSRFFEVTLEGEIVWLYRSPIGFNGIVTQGQTGQQAPREGVFRATRYLPDFPGFVGKDMAPGELIELEPWPSDCEIYEDLVSSSFEIEKLEGIILTQVFNNQYLRIESESNEELRLQIYDLNARLFYSIEIQHGESEIDLSQFPAAMYIVFITDHSSGKAYSKKILVN